MTFRLGKGKSLTFFHSVSLSVTYIYVCPKQVFLFGILNLCFTGLMLLVLVHLFSDVHGCALIKKLMKISFIY